MRVRSLTLLLAGLLAGLPSAGAPPETPLPALTREAPAEGTLGASETKAFRLDLEKDRYVRLVVEARGFRAEATVTAPSGKKLLEARTEDGKATSSFVTAEAGAYRLELRPAKKDGPGGAFLARVEEVREAAPADRKRFAAETAYAEALDLENEGSAPSLVKARARCEEALALFRETGDRKKEGMALDELGWLHDLAGERREAIALYEKALAVRREVGDRAGEAETLQGMGLSYTYLGEPQKALEIYDQALKLSRELKDKNREGGTLHNIGGVYWSIDEMQKALDQYALALPLLQEAGGQRAVATTLNTTGDTYRRLGDYTKALDYFDRVLKIRREIGDRRGESITLQNIALVHDAQGDPNKALGYFEKALEIRRATGDKQGEAYSLGGIGGVYRELGDLKKALEVETQSLVLRRQLGERAGLAETLESLGSIHADLGDRDAADANYKESLDLTRAAGNRSWEAMAHAGLARTARDRGDLAGARKEIEAALEIVETLRSRIARQELRTTYFATVQRYYEFYIDLLMRMHREAPAAGHDAEAFRASESARARSLLETLAEARADIRGGVEPSLLSREREARLKLGAKEQYKVRVLQGKPTEAQATAAETEVRAALGEWEEARAEIRRKSPRYAALTQPRPSSAAELAPELGDDTLLLEYALGGERSFLWALSKGSLSSFELPKRAEIERAAREVYALLTARNQHPEGETPAARAARIAAADAAFAPKAGALSKILLDPVAAALPGKRLALVRDGVLQYLPFEALPEPGGTAPLVDGHEVVNLPSASVLSLLRRDAADARPAPKLVAVLADPVFERDDPRVARKGSKPVAQEPAASGDAERSASESGVGRFTRLRFTRQEAEGISSLAPKSSGLAALDFSASRATATSPGLGDFRLLHFATHGLLNSVHPELSGLVLSLVNEKGEPEDGFLRLHEIYNLKLAADLVVLSACQTALGKEVRGEGLVGLTRGFMYAGAPRVVASLWNVQDRATAELMKRFYEGMLAGKRRPAAALRAAQVSMWKEKRFTFPYFWSAFELQGEWR